MEDKYKLVDLSDIGDQLPDWDQDWRFFVHTWIEYFTLEWRKGRLIKMKELKWAL